MIMVLLFVFGFSAVVATVTVLSACIVSSRLNYWEDRSDRDNSSPDPSDGDASTARSHHYARQSLSERGHQCSKPLSIPPGRWFIRRQGCYIQRIKGYACIIHKAILWQQPEIQVPANILSVHRAERRHIYYVLHLWRQRMQDVQVRRMA